MSAATLNAPRRRRPPVTLAAEVAPPAVADIATPDTPTPPRPVRSPVMTVEQYECPTCEGKLPAQSVANAFGEHPTLLARQRTCTMDCPHCGSVNVATFVGVGLTWTVESVVRQGAGN